MNIVYFPLAFILMMNAMAIQLSEFVARPAVQRALATKPHTTESVLTFFFGVDYRNSQEVQQELRQGKCLQSMTDLWYAGGPEYDSLCGNFRDAVRLAGQGSLLEPGEASALLTPVDQVVAQMILCDQLARNVFRGKSEAFAYEEVALAASRQVTSSVLDKDKESSSSSPAVLTGEVYPPYLAFSVTALIHSESQKDHERAIQVLEHAQKHSPADLKGIWDLQMKFELEHKDVVDRFGRYPHRNASKGRQSTAEEEAWLADVDNLPGWAKSQMATTDEKE